MYKKIITLQSVSRFYVVIKYTELEHWLLSWWVIVAVNCVKEFDYTNPSISMCLIRFLCSHCYCLNSTDYLNTTFYSTGCQQIKLVEFSNKDKNRLGLTSSVPSTSNDVVFNSITKFIYGSEYGNTLSMWSECCEICSV